ncbi:hypothetical protein ACQ4PT_045009 [Festuca glaucescens]
MAKTKPMEAAAAAAAAKKQNKRKKGKGSMKGKNGPAAVAMKARGAAAAERSNPFEAIWSRRKFDVLGKKRKGEERRTSGSRSEAIHKRENTLLKEFEQCAKSSVFHDRRIGERTRRCPSLIRLFSVISESTWYVPAKLKRVSKYNLSDREEDKDDIHHSRMLSGNDDFDEEVPLGDDSDEEGKSTLSKKCLSLHNGDLPSEIDRPEETHGHKSKKEVMSEIILKSKFYKEKPDAYDKLVKEMVMDQRARPSDRTKTPEELAQEEKERLEQLEKERHKRMTGTAESSDEDDGDDDEGNHHMKADNSKSLSGDDLGDSFSFDKSTKRKKGWVDEIYEKEGRKIGEDVAPGDEGSSDGCEDEDGDEEDAGDEDDSNDNDFDGRSETEIVEIISRIRTCNSIRLTAENRKKMQVFYGVLLQYFAVLATKSPVKFKVIETLVKPLIEMTGETPYFAAICARERLVHTRTRLCEDIKVPGKSSWPSLKTLLLLRTGVLLSVVECLRGFVIIHEELRSFPEIFMPISSLMQQILEKSDLPALLRDFFHEVIDFIKKRSAEHYASREPLQMRKQKPEPIKQLNPKFEENYIKGLDYDPDRERAQLKKLKKRLKSEKKGAVRELRKDNHFLTVVKEKDRIKQEQERTEKYGKAMAFLQEQESAFKSGQLGKGKKRRR